LEERLTSTVLGASGDVFTGGVEKKLNIQGLKRFALDKLPRDSPLRELLLSERDELDKSEFLAKMDVWLKLLGFRRGA